MCYGRMVGLFASIYLVITVPCFSQSVHVTGWCNQVINQGSENVLVCEGVDPAVLAELNRQLSEQKITVEEALRKANTISEEQYLAIVDRAAKTKPLGDIGQINAAELLLHGNKSFDGVDLSGVYFSKGRFDKGSFQKADLRGTNFDQVTARAARFGGANLSLATINNAQVEGADLSSALLAYADVRGSSFGKIKGERSNWFAVDGRETDFHAADLRHATFMFADLRNANFDGAQLEGTLFIGCLLQGSSFKHSIIKNTDFTSSVVDPHALSAAQLRETCRTPPSREDGSFTAVLMERTPSSRFSTGYAYDRFYEYIFGFPFAQHRSLPTCAKRSVQSRVSQVFETSEGLERISDGLTLQLDHDLVEKAGRRSRYEARAANHLAAIQAALAPTHFLTSTAKPSAGLTKALRSASSELTHGARVWLNDDSITLLLLRHDPALQQGAEWGALAQQRLKLEQALAKRMPEWSGFDAWGPVFPPGTYAEELTVEPVSAFRAWHEGRVAALTSTVSIRMRRTFPVPAPSDGRPTWSVFESDFDVVNRTEGIAAFGHKGLKLLGLNEANVTSSFRVDGLAVHNSSLALPRARGDYQLNVPTDKSSNGQHARLYAEVDLDVLSAHPLVSEHGGRLRSRLFAAVPQEIRLIQDGKTLSTLVVGERLRSQELKKFVSNRTFRMVDGQGGRMLEHFASDSRLTRVSLGDDVLGTWSSKDDQLCRSYPESAMISGCYALYKEIDGYLLVLAENSAGEKTLFYRVDDSWIGSVKKDALFPSSNADIVGIRLGMPIQNAIDVARRHLGPHAETFTLQVEREPILGHAIVLADANRSEMISLSLYSAQHDQIVGGVSRLIQGKAVIIEDITTALTKKYGRATAGDAYDNTAYFHWVFNNEVGKQGESHPCLDKSLVRHQNLYIPEKNISLLAPALVTGPLVGSVGCGPVLGVRIDSKRNQMLMWMLDTSQIVGIIRHAEVEKENFKRRSGESEENKIKF